MLRQTCFAFALSPAIALLLTAAAAAQEAGKPSRFAEPEVRQIVVEDDNARIDELRVRGVTRSIKVHPKRGGANYEIQPLDPNRSPANSADGTRTAGQRVWNVFQF